MKRLSILFLAFTAMLAACNPKPGSVSPVPDPQKPDVPTEDVKVTIASNQDWLEGESNLDPLFAALHFHITGGGTIYGIRITGEASDELSGVFMTDGRVLKETVSASNVVYVTGTSAIALPADVYAVIKPGNYSELTLKVFDSYGGSLTQLVRIDAGIAPGKVFDIPEIAYQREGGDVPVEGDNSFSLATYNVLVNDGRREEMQLDKCSDALGKAIKDCQADILCLGELDDIFASQLPSIAQTAGAMEYVWNISNPNKVTSRGLEYYFSNGIAYNPRKFNLEAKGMYWYTSSGEWTIMSSVASSSHVPKYCTFVWAKLRHLPTGKVICVISTHLPLATDGASAGYETGQANYLCANALNSFAAYMQVPCVMGADLNASALSTDANASGYTWLKRRWVDVYERLQKTGQLPSFYETYCGTLSGSSDNYYYDVAAFTKNYPSRRIDHIMYTSGEGCELVPEAYATIMRGYYVGTTRYCPSDHLPVVVEFVIK